MQARFRVCRKDRRGFLYSTKGTAGDEMKQNIIYVQERWIMHGIPLHAGINNCIWNIDGKCTNYRVTRNPRNPCWSKDWDSKQNCTLTIIGVHKCGGFEPEKWTPFISHTTKQGELWMKRWLTKLFGEFTGYLRKQLCTVIPLAVWDGYRLCQLVMMVMVYL